MKNISFKIITLVIISLTSYNLQSQSVLLTNEFSNLPLGYTENERGDKIIDFSYAGYKGGGISLPDFDSIIDEEYIISLTPNGVDDTLQIQNAINEIGSQPINNNGFRGGILLKSGDFYISERIDISIGGIIIKGSGGDIRDENRTIIVDKSIGEWASFFVNTGGRPQLENNSIKITDDYVAVGSFQFTVSNINNLNVGDSIIVNINPQQKWIDDQQYNNVGGAWNNIFFFQDGLKLERIITEINLNNNLIKINAPVTSSINKIDGYNIGSIQKLSRDTRQENIGFEDFILASDYNCIEGDNEFNQDENHASVGIYFFNGKNGWAKNLTGFFYKQAFIKSRNYISISGVENRWEVFWGLTVEDCAMLDGVSLDTPNNHAGGREYYFDINSPSSLVQRSYGRNARHTFILNSPTNLVTFLDCLAEGEHLSSEPHQNFSTGVLFDNFSTDGVLKLNSVHNSSHGQRAANSMIWNTTSYNKRYFDGDIHLDKPLNNLGEQWLIGAIIKSDTVANNFYNVPNIQSPSRKFGTSSPKSYYGEPESYIGEPAHKESIENHVYPRSLYLRQLQDRLGSVAAHEIVSSTQQSLVPEDETLFDELKSKYIDIPEFMCLDELLDFYVEDFCIASNDGFLDPETWIEQNSNYSNYQFETGDFNGDGLDDVIAISKHDARFVVWEALPEVVNGKRFLHHHQWIQQNADYSNYQFEIGDFNGDKRDDVIAISKHNARFVVWESLETPINNGERFLWHHQWIQQDANYSNYQFEIGDFNGDKRDDVIAISKHNARFVVWESLETPINNGERFLWHHQWIQQDANYSNYQFEIGDFNGDKRDDVIAISKHNARFVVWKSLETPINNGERFLWHHQWIQQDANYSNYQFEIGDFNGDKRDDVIAINSTINDSDFHVWKSLVQIENGQRFSNSQVWYNDILNYSDSTFKVGNFNEDCNHGVISIEPIATTLDVWELGSNITLPPNILQNKFNTPISKSLLTGQNKFNELKIYPNPTNSQLTISSQSIIDFISILDVNGRQLKRLEINSLEFNLNVNDLYKGLYFLEITTGELKQIEKFIKN